ncbi:uncharacterized protein LOC115717411 isoform X1 [Cannabis sativa]|uniref:uncharacterized protein LOC115717411 isoform X1 n=1 Tax=Cannabis sativa TaxID=3483 RepID=UPI0029C9E402|nr:uncharacterized protein LOC115717411 isoform X1 [Cannabis sativa]
MENSSSTSSITNNGVLVANQKKPSEGIRLENPFTLKVGQVFTGFGFGCGIGIGVGRPINLGSIPVLNEVMSAARGATYAFSGATRHVNDSFKKIGAKNVQAGVGCGVGFGHGFGIGLALKPTALQKIQVSFAVVMSKVMTKLGLGPQLPFGQGVLPSSLQGGMSLLNNSSSQNPMGSIMQLATQVPDNASQGLTGYESKSKDSSYAITSSKNPSIETPYGSRTEKVLSNFLQNPVLKGETSELKEVDGRQRTENTMLHMVLKHQKVIEELKEENEKLRQVLVEELKIPFEKLHITSSSSKNNYPCSDCFECRRRQRKK